MSYSNLAQLDAVAHSRLYRAVWRWHFYAGLIVIPFLMMLALTGAYMMIYSDLSNELGWAPNVTITGTPLAVSAQAKAALAEIKDGKLQTYIAPRGPDSRPILKLAKVMTHLQFRLIPIPPKFWAIIMSAAPHAILPNAFTANC